MDSPEAFPPDAKLAYKGVIFEVWQWDQQMFDGSTVMFEGLKRPNTVDIIAVADGGILIEEQEQPGMPKFISCPGGRVDEGEDPLAAAKRELLEETGYESNDWELWKLYRPSAKMDWSIYMYIARGCQLKHKQHLDPGERIATRMIDFEMFLLLADEPTFRGQEIVMEMLRAQANPAYKEDLRERLFGSHA